MDLENYTLPPKTLLVIVQNGRWDAYGPTNFYGRFLLEMLRREGGVADTVPRGYYHYTVRFGRRIYSNLTPVK